MLNKNIEILSPVGDFECLKAAVQNGANSVYLGASDFNARYSATNFDTENLEKAIIYAKTRGVNVHLALNILIKNNEFEKAFNLAKKAYELGVDAIIVQDLGLAVTLIKSFPDLPIHASTQMTVHNLEGIKILEKLGFKRAVLSRELSFEEIDYICKNSNIEIETFIHGALCVSYSGQCLFSSIIGGRSGNRGKCAGTCRLPYELLNIPAKLDNVTKHVLDKGYLLSTKDLCGLEYLPKLVEAGVICFKIEGRMKTPEYVATVTRIYRKYLDKILNNEKYIIDPEDNKELMLVFNRGGFSTAYFDNTPNKNLVFKEKPNHIGLYLGKISKFNSNKGYITLKLENNLSIGDKIAIDNNGISNNYTVSEMMINNINMKNVENGNIVTIGRMKGDISINDKIYLVESKELVVLSTNSYQNVENKQLELACNINILKNKPIEISAKIISNNFKNISCSLITDIIPEQAKSAPISKEKIIEQFNKTKNTIFKFSNLNINLDDNLFLTIGSLNELRRMILEKLGQQLENSIKRTINKTNLTITNKSEILLKQNNILNEVKPKISILLNVLNENFNYSNLKNVDKLYIPLKYFINPKFKNIILNLDKNFNLYIYFPTIMKKNYINLLNLNLKNIFTTYNIKGAIISNIGQLILFNNLNDFNNLELIGNYTLNVFNNITVDNLTHLNISTFTLSPELDRETLISLSSSNNNAELIIYGNAPVMNSNYCVLGKTNNCYKECKKYCQMKNNKFYLKDRLNFNFRVIPDNIDTISTIYNCKITSIKWKDFNINNLRIDILDETVEEINLIIEKALINERFEGKEYTNANLNKEI